LKYPIKNVIFFITKNLYHAVRERSNVGVERGFRSALKWLGGFLLLISCLALLGSWGFFGHKKINQLAVFTLPPDMIGFYKKNMEYITDASCNPDRRRYAVPEEAARHYIDLDDYGDSAAHKLPRYWKDAVAKYSNDSLQAHGIVPWHVANIFYALRDAFFVGDPQKILLYSAELGHYVGDANVPLHTTSNYDGQRTGQNGIHGFWESRLPELYFDEYDFLVGRASYVKNVQLKAWEIITAAHASLDSVLSTEKKLSATVGDNKFSFETRGKQTIKVFSKEYSKQYHRALNGMVERQMQRSVKAVGDLWFTAWVDAGQPDLKKLIGYQPTDEELAARKEELKKWKEVTFKPRAHEGED
jgi:hypothetical protein